MILGDALPNQIRSAGGLAGDEALTAEATKEVFADIGGDFHRRLGVADAVGEEFGFDGVIDEGVEDDVRKFGNGGAGNFGSEGCA